jgi:hypothetical protein
MYENHRSGFMVSAIPNLENLFWAQAALSPDQSQAEVFVSTILNLTDLI